MAIIHRKMKFRFHKSIYITSFIYEKSFFFVLFNTLLVVKTNCYFFISFVTFIFLFIPNLVSQKWQFSVTLFCPKNRSSLSDIHFHQAAFIFTSSHYYLIIPLRYYHDQSKTRTKKKINKIKCKKSMFNFFFSSRMSRNVVRLILAYFLV